jgi:hypothetical protein
MTATTSGPLGGGRYTRAPRFPTWHSHGMEPEARVRACNFCKRVRRGAGGGGRGADQTLGGSCAARSTAGPLSATVCRPTVSVAARGQQPPGLQRSKRAAVVEHMLAEGSHLSIAAK